MEKNFFVFYADKSRTFIDEAVAKVFAVETIYQLKWREQKNEFSAESSSWKVKGTSGTLAKDELVIVVESEKYSNVIYRQFLKTTTVLDLFSPTKEIPYTAEYAVKKGLVRSSLSSDFLEIQKLHTSSYGDWDGIIKVKNLCPSESIWSDSINWNLTGEIPIHVNGSGRISAGFACGNDHDTDEDEQPFQLNYKIGGRISFSVKNSGVNFVHEGQDYQDMFSRENKDFLSAMTDVLHRLLTEHSIAQMTN